MKSHSARRLRIVPACIISALSLGALLAPGAANATLGTQCSGPNITAQGASLEALAQKVWDAGFNTSSNKLACSGTQGSKGKPTITYVNTGSGAGLESWGEFKKPTNYTSANAFIGSSEAPTSSAIAEIESNETKLVKETLETIPVTQLSIAIYVNLPTGCTATSTADPGRLVLNNSTLQGIWAGTVKTWAEITDDGDKLSGGSCNPATAITRVARFDQAGSTHILKRYLGLINPGSLTDEAEASHTWNDLSDGSLNTDWPKAAAVVRPAKKGDAEEAAKVEATAGSIGYSNLAELRATNKFSGTGNGAGTAKFWIPIQNAQKGKAPKLKFTYADPATNGDVEAAGNANCNKTAYTNGSNPFPPPAVSAPWNEVTTKTTEKAYTLCGFTYALAFTSYSAYPGTELGEATTVNNFLRFVLETKTGGGQKEIGENHDYLALPKGAVLTDATNGAKNTQF